MRRILGFAFACVTASCLGSDSDDVTEPIDAPTDAPVIVDAAVDAASFQCANDSSIEPNNDPQFAFVTPIDSPLLSYTLVGLALCPSGDVDHYRFNISTAGQNFEATVTSVPGREAPAVHILDASGTQVGNGTVSGGPNRVRAELPNPAVGAYTVRVLMADFTENNYDLQLRVCSQPLPCP